MEHPRSHVGDSLALSIFSLLPGYIATNRDFAEVMQATNGVALTASKRRKLLVIKVYFYLFIKRGFKKSVQITKKNLL